MKHLLLIIFLMNIFVCHSSEKTFIKVKVLNESSHLLNLTIHEDQIRWQKTILQATSVNNEYIFKFDISKAYYMRITNSNRVEILCLMEPGDSLFITYDEQNYNKSLSFDGKPAKRIHFIQDILNETLYNKIKNYIPRIKKNQSPFDDVFQFIDSIQAKYSILLTQIETELLPETRIVLRGFMIGHFLSKKFSTIGLVNNESISKTIKERKDKVTERTIYEFTKLFHFDDEFSASDFYVNSVYNILFVQHSTMVLEKELDPTLQTKYQYLKDCLPPKIADKVLAMFFEYDLKSDIGGLTLTEIKSRLDSLIKDRVYSAFVDSIYNGTLLFARGSKAPQFKVINVRNEVVDLTDFKGKVLYIDFWFEACKPCHLLFDQLRSVKDFFKENPHVVFLNVSIDETSKWHKALQRYRIEGYHVNVGTGVSADKMTSAYRIKSYPATFLIDKNGMFHSVNPQNSPDILIREINLLLNKKGPQ